MIDKRGRFAKQSDWSIHEDLIFGVQEADWLQLLLEKSTSSGVFRIFHVSIYHLNDFIGFLKGGLQWEEVTGNPSVSWWTMPKKLGRLRGPLDTSTLKVP